MKSKSLAALALCALMLLAFGSALAAPSDLKVPPQAIPTQAEGELNMKYLREISPIADLKLIFGTIAAVIRG